MNIVIICVCKFSLLPFSSFFSFNLLYSSLGPVLPSLLLHVGNCSHNIIGRTDSYSCFKQCSTKGTMYQPPAEISLQQPGLPKTIQPYVVVVLYAPGFKHEHQRYDARKYLLYRRAGRSLLPNAKYRGMTPYVLCVMQ